MNIPVPPPPPSASSLLYHDHDPAEDTCVWSNKPVFGLIHPEGCVPCAHYMLHVAAAHRSRDPSFGVALQDRDTRQTRVYLDGLCRGDSLGRGLGVGMGMGMGNESYQNSLRAYLDAKMELELLQTRQQLAVCQMQLREAMKLASAREVQLRDVRGELNGLRQEHEGLVQFLDSLEFPEEEQEQEMPQTPPKRELVPLPTPPTTPHTSEYPPSPTPSPEPYTSPTPMAPTALPPPISTATPSYEIFVDSSGWGIGFVLNGRWLAWPLQPGWNTSGRDNNWAEMVAVELGIRILISAGIHSKTIKVRSDNTGVVHALKTGRTKHVQQKGVLDRVFELCKGSEIGICVMWVETKRNVADGPSRGIFPNKALLFPTQLEVPPHLAELLHPRIQ